MTTERDGLVIELRGIATAFDEEGLVETESWPNVAEVLRSAADALSAAQRSCLGELVTCSLAYPDWVCHQRRLDCEHEMPHLMAACGAFKSALLSERSPRPATHEKDAGSSKLSARWQELFWVLSPGQMRSKLRSLEIDVGLMLRESRDASFPVHQVVEWQCRYVDPDTHRCCTLPRGHDGTHFPQPSLPCPVTQKACDRRCLGACVRSVLAGRGATR